MKNQLIALDLDGTLLYDWQTLDTQTRNYLIHLRSEGHDLVIATGRPYRSSVRYYRALGLDTPLINYNGGLITWKSNPDFEEVNVVLNRETVIDIFEQNKPYIYNAFCEIKDDLYVMRRTDMYEELLHLEDGARLHVGDFKDILPAGTNGFIIIANPEKGHLIEEYVQKYYSDEVSTRNWGDEYQFIIELYTPETNKGKALKHVAETLGYRKDDIIAFGDGHNDIEMLQYAGLGVAMANAQENLKAVADVVSPHTHQQQAIKHFLIDYFKKVDPV